MRPSSQRHELAGNGEGRDHDSQLRLLPGEDSEDPLEHHDAANKAYCAE
jgi:hypothetical protein